MPPLTGIRVADFTNHAAGPYCVLALALLGAEVIRIESRARLDIQRRPHPVYGRFEVPNFDYLAGAKKSITLDLKTDQGRELAKELVARSDVVVENFRPGVMQRLGLDWPVLRELNPRLVMLSLSAYGQEGPESRRPGYAPIFAAEGGLGYVTGYRDGAPGEIRNNMDHQAGMTSTFVILSLLEERETSQQGSYADVAAREVASMLVGECIVEALGTGKATRIGTGHEVWAPHGVYPAAGTDRWIALAVRCVEEWERLVKVMDAPTWCTDDLLHEARRRERRVFIDARIAEWTAAQDATTLVAELQRAGVCADVSMTAADFVDDEHLRARDAITTLHDAEFGERTTVGAPWRFLDSPVRYDRWSPRLGEHNVEVICGLLGHSREQLQQWVDAEVVY